MIWLSRIGATSGIGVFNAEAGVKVRLGGAALRAVGADCGRRGAGFLYSQLYGREAAGTPTPAGGGISLVELVRHDHAVFGALQTPPGQKRQPHTCQLTRGRRSSCHGIGKRFRRPFNSSLPADTRSRVRECFPTTLTMFLRPMKKSNVSTSGQPQWVNVYAPSRLVRLHFVAAVDTKKADGRVRLVSARSALHAWAGTKVAGETR